MRLQAHHAGGVDHPHYDLLFVRREADKIGLGPDGRKGLPVDRRAVGLINMRHQCPPTRMEGSLTMSAPFNPRRTGSSRVEPPRTRSKPALVATSVTADAPERAQPLAQPETCSRVSSAMRGASAAASARVSAWASRQRGAPLQAMTRKAGS